MCPSKIAQAGEAQKLQTTGGEAGSHCALHAGAPSLTGRALVVKAIHSCWLSQPLPPSIEMLFLANPTRVATGCDHIFLSSFLPPSHPQPSLSLSVCRFENITGSAPRRLSTHVTCTGSEHGVNFLLLCVVRFLAASFLRMDGLDER